MRTPVLAISAAIAGGLVFNAADVPAGALLGSILGSALMQARLKERLRVPRIARRLLRIGVGSLIGLGMTRDSFMQIGQAMGPVVATIAGTFVISFGSAWLIWRYCGLGKTEALLGAVPAGITEMSINAASLNGDPVVVTTLHLFRLMSILGMIPLLLMLL